MTCCWLTRYSHAVEHHDTQEAQQQDIVCGIAKSVCKKLLTFPWHLQFLLYTV